MSLRGPFEIAFVTHARMPEITEDDELAAAALRARNAEVTAAVWGDPAVDWASFDAVVLRSTWDYHQRLDAFLGWLGQLERARAKVWNPVATVRWNLDKRYLLELSARGVPIVPTARLEQGSRAALGQVLQQQGWDDAVVKPAVSLNSTGTFRTSLETAREHETELRRLLEQGDVLVQRFAGEIVEQGEWSLVFLGGAFSHAVVKRPRAGDFRTQESFGGTHARATQPEELLAQARAALDASGASPLYARVDGVVVDGVLWLMELELIEPSLFFAGEPLAAERFAEAVLARAQAGRSPY